MRKALYTLPPCPLYMFVQHVHALSSYCLLLPPPPSTSLFIFSSICAKLLWTLLLPSPLRLLLARSPTKIAVPVLSPTPVRLRLLHLPLLPIARCSAVAAIAAMAASQPSNKLVLRRALPSYRSPKKLYLLGICNAQGTPPTASLPAVSPFTP